MLDKKEVKEILENFNKYVIQQARTNLTKKGSNHSKKLYDSFEQEVHVTDNAIDSNILSDEYDQYGIFQDLGVKGVGGVRKTTSKFNPRNNKGKLWKQNAKNSPFKYGNKKPSAKHFESWAKSKGLSPYAVRESVYHQGIKPTYFLTKPFERAFESLPDQIIEAYGLDLENFMDFTLNKDASNL